MAISVKTRKLLWGRSGNRCALCNTELVGDKTEVSDHLLLGEECHIISSQTDGPRHTVKTNFDYDGYENLILLCCNDHRRVDTQLADYTTDKLSVIKNAHELKVKNKLAEKVGQENQQEFLVRIDTGKGLVNLVDNVFGYEFDYDEPNTNDETMLITGFISNIEDYSCVMGDYGASDKVELGLTFKNMIAELEQNGFLLFGNRFKRQMKYENGKTDIWNIAAVHIRRSNNPEIIAVPPTAL